MFYRPQRKCRHCLDPYANDVLSSSFSLSTQSVIFDEISLPDLSVAECSTKNANHSFQVRKTLFDSDLFHHRSAREEEEERRCALDRFGRKEKGESISVWLHTRTIGRCSESA